MTDDNPELRRRLEPLRHALLALHKALIESERLKYERTIGPIQSPNHLFQLVMHDPWFAWLAPLSQLIVAFDEAIDAREPMTLAQGRTLVQKTRELLVASEDGSGFAGHYHEALQSDPDIVMAHADVVRARDDLR